MPKTIAIRLKIYTHSKFKLLSSLTFCAIFDNLSYSDMQNYMLYFKTNHNKVYDFYKTK
jgi:hypothetical protein